MVNSSSILSGTVLFIRNVLRTNITDPITSTRPSGQKFVMTSYPKRTTKYPIITVRGKVNGDRKLGQQSEKALVDLAIEVRVWGRNQKEKDELANNCYKRLRDIQFTASTGSIANNLHNFTLLSATELDEPGEDQPKSRILNIQYNFYDV